MGFWFINWFWRGLVYRLVLNFVWLLCSLVFIVISWVMISSHLSKFLRPFYGIPYDLENISCALEKICILLWWEQIILYVSNRSSIFQDFGILADFLLIVLSFTKNEYQNFYYCWIVYFSFQFLHFSLPYHGTLVLGVVYIHNCYILLICWYSCHYEMACLVSSNISGLKAIFAQY